MWPPAQPGIVSTAPQAIPPPVGSDTATCQPIAHCQQIFARILSSEIRPCPAVRCRPRLARRLTYSRLPLDAIATRTSKKWAHCSQTVSGQDDSSTILLRPDIGQSILPIANRVNEEHSRRWTLKLPFGGMFGGRMRFKRRSLTFDLPRIQCVPLSRLLAHGTLDEKRSHVPDRHFGVGVLKS